MIDKEKLIEFLESEIMSCRIADTASDKAIEWECKRIIDRANAGMFDEQG